MLCVGDVNVMPEGICPQEQQRQSDGHVNRSRYFVRPPAWEPKGRIAIHEHCECVNVRSVGTKNQGWHREQVQSLEARFRLRGNGKCMGERAQGTK